MPIRQQEYRWLLQLDTTYLSLAPVMFYKWGSTMGCVLVAIALFLLIFVFSISPLLGILVLGAIIGVSYYFKNKEEDKQLKNPKKSMKLHVV